MHLEALAYDWCEDLACYPMPVLKRAVRNARKVERFFPCLAVIMSYAENEYALMQERAAAALPENTMTEQKRVELALEWAPKIRAKLREMRA